VARTGVLVAIAVLVSAASMIGLSARAVVARSSCSSDPVVVNVAVSYDIAPAIDSIARAFNTQHQTVDGRCVQVQVTQGQPSAVAAQIDGQASLHGLSPVDAWIPDSTLWIDLARNYPTGAQVVQSTGVEVARSPILLVTSPAVAKATDLFGAPVSWNLILPQPFGGPPVGMGLSVDIPDPTDSAVGLSTLLQVSRALGPGRTGRDGFTKFVYSTETTEDFDSTAALATFVASTGAPFFRMAVTEASEQAVIAYDRVNPHAPLVAKYPSGTSNNLGSPELNYPYVLTNSKSDTQQAAKAFGQYLTGSYAQSVVRYYGFRSANDVADSFPANSGLSSQTLQIAPTAGATEAVTSARSSSR
jgi:ABC-type molybdate transport system substrate-binding protein